MYQSFAPVRAAIAKESKGDDAILDGEIVCLDAAQCESAPAKSQTWPPVGRRVI